MKIFKFCLLLFLGFGIILAGCGSGAKVVLLDDFENPVSAGPQGSVDFGSGAGSSLDVSASSGEKYSGNQSLKVVFDAVSGGYMWVARGFGLDAKNSTWLIKPEAINWKDFSAFSFYMFGSDSKAKIAFDIKDDGNEMWRFIVEDNFTGWKQVVCPFKDFFARGDWQPDNADKNAQMNFPIKSFQFEPRPIAKGTVYFDRVELVK
jgi:hypothetical protein